MRVHVDEVDLAEFYHYEAVAEHGFWRLRAGGGKTVGGKERAVSALAYTLVKM